MKITIDIPGLLFDTMKQLAAREGTGIEALAVAVVDLGRRVASVYASRSYW